MSIHRSWKNLLDSQAQELLDQLPDAGLTPQRDKVFAAFEEPLEGVRVVIIGQDPYPTAGYATGLAFSVTRGNSKLPASLKNIFKEYSEDLELPFPTSGDLSAWSKRGVLLLNRTLTTEIGKTGAHMQLGWRSITDEIARELGERGVVAVLWGSHAQELSHYFKDRVESVHPSPLSAYRGFFGSKPFSRVNKILIDRGEEPIDWRLE
mgnify:CR=1 FL=1